MPVQFLEKRERADEVGHLRARSTKSLRTSPAVTGGVGGSDIWAATPPGREDNKKEAGFTLHE